jgi:hypothetical protein
MDSSYLRIRRDVTILGEKCKSILESVLVTTHCEDFVASYKTYENARDQYYPKFNLLWISSNYRTEQQRQQMRAMREAEVAVRTALIAANYRIRAGSTPLPVLKDWQRA